MNLHLSDTLKLPIDVATQTIGILGIRGSGKTNTAGVGVEELLRQNMPTLIIDPTDVWWGLKSSASGKEAGFPVVVFGGEHGDIAVGDTHGKQLAEFIVNEQVPTIVSLRHLTKGGQRRLVTELLEVLYHLKGQPKHRTPLTVIIDEAPLFCPQQMSGEVLRTVGAVEDLIARGRTSGFGVWLISQRAATLNKNVLTQAETLITHRLIGPQDRKALMGWVEENCDVQQAAEILTSLPKLANGEAWVWSPKLDIMKRVQMRLRKTFDSSATPTAGKKIAAPRKLAEVDLASLEAKMAAAVEEAAANDPKKLKAEVARLKKELAAAAQKAVPAETEIQKVEVPALRPGERKQLIKLHSSVGDVAKQLTGVERSISEILARLTCAERAFGDLTQSPPPAMRAQSARASTDSAGRPIAPRPAMSPGSANGQAGRPSPRPSVLPSVRARSATPKPASGDEQPLGKGERAILCCCAQYDDGATREQLTVLTGYRRSSRDTYLQRLKERGFVMPQGERLLATQEGIEFLGDDFQPLPTGEALRNYWLNKLDRGERTILEVLIGAHPDSIPRQQIDEVTGYKRSSRDTYLQRMSSKRLVVSEGGQVRASDLLFD